MWSLWMILCETEPLVHERRGLSKQAEDEQVFVPVLPILDSPCFGLDDGIFLWDADGRRQRIGVLSAKNEAAAIYLQIEGRTVIHARSVPLKTKELIFSN
uniref:Uncharacterized protein n=1 Tax=Meloidogyne incognita TaxID=6306 RepID=A0A914M828_MELIC